MIQQREQCTTDVTRYAEYFNIFKITVMSNLLPFEIFLLFDLDASNCENVLHFALRLLCAEDLNLLCLQNQHARNYYTKL